MSRFITSPKLSKAIRNAFRYIVTSHVDESGYYEKKNFDALVKSYVRDMTHGDYPLSETRIVVYKNLMDIFLKGAIPDSLKPQDLYRMAPAQIYLYVIAQNRFSSGKVTPEQFNTITRILSDYKKEWDDHFETTKR